LQKKKRANGIVFSQLDFYRKGLLSFSFEESLGSSFASGFGANRSVALLAPPGYEMANPITFNWTIFQYKKQKTFSSI